MRSSGVWDGGSGRVTSSSKRTRSSHQFSQFWCKRVSSRIHLPVLLYQLIIVWKAAMEVVPSRVGWTGCYGVSSLMVQQITAIHPMLHPIPDQRESSILFRSRFWTVGDSVSWQTLHHLSPSPCAILCTILRTARKLKETCSNSTSQSFFSESALGSLFSLIRTISHLLSHFT